MTDFFLQTPLHLSLKNNESPSCPEITRAWATCSTSWFTMAFTLFCAAARPYSTVFNKLKHCFWRRTAWKLCAKRHASAAQSHWDCPPKACESTGQGGAATGKQPHPEPECNCKTTVFQGCFLDKTSDNNPSEKNILTMQRAVGFM